MKRQAIFLVALLASTALVGCGGHKPTPSSSETPASTSTSATPSSDSSDAPSSSSVAPSSSSTEPSSSSTPAPSSSSQEQPSSSSSQPSSSSSLGPTPISPVDPDEEEEFDFTERQYPNELLTSRRIVSVFVNEELGVKGTPQFKYSGQNVSFSIANPAIATVTENGVVKGVSKGKTVLTVSDKDNPDFKAEMDVTVNEEFANQTEAKARNTAIYNASKSEGRQSLVDKNMITRDIYRYREDDTNKENPFHYYSEFLDQRITLDKTNAYFRLVENDSEVKAEEGEMEFSNGDMVVENNEFYDTYLFRESGSAKRYLKVNAQDYMSGKDRLAPVYDALDNVFTSGKGIFSNTLQYGSLSWMNRVFNMLSGDDSGEGEEGEEGQDEVEGEVTATRYGFCDDESMVILGSSSYSDVFDQDDESRYGQPCYAPYTADQTMRLTVTDGRVVSYHVDVLQKYSYGGYNYEERYSVDHVYSNVTADDLYIPNKADFTEVFDLFDLY